MRAIICAAALSAITGTATASQYASLYLDSVTPASINSLSTTGDGTERLGISGDLGPFFPGPFTVTLGLTFESFTIAGDGVGAFFTILPDFAQGQLALTSFTLEADLFDGGEHVSSLEMIGDYGNSRSGGGFDVVGIASPFHKDGVTGYIGDHGTIQLTMNFVWTGAPDSDMLNLNIAEGSEINYMASLYPTPGAGAAFGIGAVMAMRRRRR